MTMMTPERTASAAERQLARMTLSHSSSECSEYDMHVEEKKSMDDGDMDMDSANISAKELGQKNKYRNMVSSEPGSKFLPEKGRYVLYASRACPNSHWALMVRVMKGLEDTVVVKFVHPQNNDNRLVRNWVVSHEIPDDSLASLKSDEGEFQTVEEIYQQTNNNTIPLLYDQEHRCIVNNNANDIAIMFNSAFNELAKNSDLELFPKNEAQLHDWLYPLLRLTPSNDPPYYYNLSPKQLDYAFQRATTVLQKQRYLLSNTSISAADLQLFAMLVRYDSVYSKYLECPPQLLHNKALLDYCRDIYQQPGIPGTVSMREIQLHFLGSTKGQDVLADLLKAPHQRHWLSTPAPLPAKEAELQEWLYPLLQSTPHTMSVQQLEVAFGRASQILQTQRYLLSNDCLSAADLRLFAALVEHDVVYAKYLGCHPQLLHNKALMDYSRDIYQQPCLSETVQLEEIQSHYLGSLLKVPHKRHLL